MLGPKNPISLFASVVVPLISRLMGGGLVQATARGFRSRRCCSRWRSADLLLAINPLRDLLLLCATSLLADLLLIGEGGESGEREHEEGGGPKQQEGEM